MSQWGSPLPSMASMRIQTEFRMRNLNRIPPPTTLTTGKRKTSFQPSIPRQSIFFPNNWRRGRSHGTWEWGDYVNKEVTALMPRGGIRVGRIPGWMGQSSSHQVEHGFGIRPAIVSSVDPPVLCFIRVSAHGREERKHLLPQIMTQSRYIVVLFRSLLHWFFPHFRE
jgi:hypothetical protein